MTQINWPAQPLLPVAWGEVFDKLTILMIKAEQFSDMPPSTGQTLPNDQKQANKQKLANVQKEYQAITAVVGDMGRFPPELQPLIDALKAVNTALWDVEDGKRDCERRQCFDEGFVQLARQVYFGNDRRAAIKRQINELLGSALMEEKSYAQYSGE